MVTWRIEEVAGSFKRLERVCHPAEVVILDGEADPGSHDQ